MAMGVGVIPIVGSYSASHDVMGYHHRRENHQNMEVKDRRKQTEELEKDSSNFIANSSNYCENIFKFYKDKNNMEAIKKLVGKKVIIRSYGAGVFFGTLNEVEKTENKWTVELLNCRRLWSWSGACSITQLAVDGTKLPNECKFTIREDSIVVSSVIEIHECTEKAIVSIEGVKEWKR